MLIFEEVLDYLQLITPPDGRNDEATPAPEIKLVGHERDGSLIYVWDDHPKNNQDAAKVTHIGVFKDGNPPLNKVLFVSTQKLNIVQATINFEQSLLVIVLAETRLIETQTCEEKIIFYDACIIETKKNLNSVYYLMRKKRNLIYVQFRYRKAPPKEEPKDGETSDLLVFLHKERIALYHLQTVDDKVLEPRIDNISKQFLWAQWDMMNQCLYFIHFRSTTDINQTEPSIFKPKLACLQFHDNLPFETVLTFPLNFPGLDENLMKYYANYVEMPLSHKITDPDFHMEILTNSSGAIHVCYQYVFRYKYSSVIRNISQDDFSVAEPFDNCHLAYYVASLHHKCLLDCIVFNIPRQIAEGSGLFFGYLKNHVVVIAPGLFAHLLDVDMDHQPCHHILWHNMPVAPVNSKFFVEGTISFLLNFNLNQVKADESLNAGCATFLDWSSKKIYKITVNNDSLLTLFQDTMVPSTRLAILHYFIIHENNMYYIQKLFESLLSDVASPEIPAIFQEFLLGSTFLAFKRHVEKEILHFIPLSLKPPRDRQVEKNSKEEKIARITYQELTNVPLTVTPPQVRFLPYKETDMWTLLAKYLSWITEKKPVRFCLSSVQEKLLQENLSEKFSEEQPDKSDAVMQTLQVVRKISSALSTKETPLNGKVYLPFSIVDEIEKTTDKIIPLLIKEFFAHLKKYLKSESDNKLHSYVSQYIICQMQQSRILCHLLLSIVGYNPLSSENIYLTLVSPATEMEHFILNLFERYILAVTDLLFPLPLGFRNFITNLAFRCLTFRNFLEYVNNSVFVITEDFVNRIIKELDDSSINVFIKQKMLTMLPQESAHKLWEEWNHPFSRNELAKKIAFNCLEFLEMDSAEATEDLSSKTSSNGATPTSKTSFPPLNVLLRAMQSTPLGKEIKNFQIIAEAALHNTSIDYQESVSDIYYDVQSSLSQDAVTLQNT